MDFLFDEVITRLFNLLSSRKDNDGFAIIDSANLLAAYGARDADERSRVWQGIKEQCASMKLEMIVIGKESDIPRFTRRVTGGSTPTSVPADLLWFFIHVDNKSPKDDGFAIELYHRLTTARPEVRCMIFTNDQFRRRGTWKIDLPFFISWFDAPIRPCKLVKKGLIPFTCTLDAHTIRIKDIPPEHKVDIPRPSGAGASVGGAGVGGAGIGYSSDGSSSASSSNSSSSSSNSSASSSNSSSSSSNSTASSSNDGHRSWAAVIAHSAVAVLAHPAVVAHPAEVDAHPAEVVAHPAVHVVAFNLDEIRASLVRAVTACTKPY